MWNRRAGNKQDKPRNYIALPLFDGYIFKGNAIHPCETMNVKTHLAALGILTLLLSIGLCGCTQENNPASDKLKFVGTWRSALTEYSDWQTIFYEDWTVESIRNDTRIKGLWVLNNGTITIQMDDDEVPFTYTYSFTDNNKRLTLVFENTGESSVFIKQ